MRLHVKFGDSTFPEVKFGEVIEVTRTADGTYTGDYFVVPKVESQTTLQTTNKLMLENVVIEKIPLYETANDDGGNTLSIGELHYA